MYATKEEPDVEPMINIREAFAWLKSIKMPSLIDNESMLEGKEQAWHFLAEHLALGGKMNQKLHENELCEILVQVCELALNGNTIKEVQLKKCLNLFKENSDKLFEGMPSLNKLMSVCMKHAFEHRVTSPLLMPTLCKRVIKSMQIHNHSLESYFLIMLQALYLAHAMGVETKMLLPWLDTLTDCYFLLAQ